MVNFLQLHFVCSMGKKSFQTRTTYKSACFSEASQRKTQKIMKLWKCCQCSTLHSYFLLNNFTTLGVCALVLVLERRGYSRSVASLPPKNNFRKERSDDRKYVCGQPSPFISPSKILYEPLISGGLRFMIYSFIHVTKSVVALLRNTRCGFKTTNRWVQHPGNRSTADSLFPVQSHQG